jgi:hypothetical protein
MAANLLPSGVANAENSAAADHSAAVMASGQRHAMASGAAITRQPSSATGTATRTSGAARTCSSRPVPTTAAASAVQVMAALLAVTGAAWQSATRSVIA